ncbi:MAG: nuclear calmodulin-binding protein [Aureliella sp.]
MFNRLSVSLALASICAVGSWASAQAPATNGASEGAAPVKASLASYGRNYASATAGYSGTPKAMAYGRSWGGAASNRDCSRFYHYPYVFYPQNFKGSEYFQSSDSLYHRYPQEMQIPVYNRKWHNYYPSSRRYHQGHQFILDVF